VFLLQRGHLVRDQRGGISGRVDGRTFLRGFESQPSTEFDCGFDLRGFGIAESVLLLYVHEGGAVKSRQSAKLIEQTLAYFDRILTFYTDAQQDGK
jgi:hypothetical protein